MGVLVVRVPMAEIESASDWLFQLGATAIEERAEAGDSALVAGFDSDDIALAARSMLSERWACRLEDTCDERLWRDEWLRHIEPVDVAGFTIHAPWHDTAGLAGRGRLISIDPGRAFGSGHHPTTQLALEALRRHVGRGDRVLDAGCGTGVLAVAAAALGADRVTGADLDHDVLAVAAANREANEGADHIELTEIPLLDLVSTFDVVVANIVIGELRPLVPLLVERSDHKLILTGFLDEQFESLLTEVDVEVVDRRVRDGWGCVTLRSA